MSKPKTDERIKVKCHCGAQLMAPRKAKGKRVKCPRCRKALTVPDPSSTVDELLYALGDEEYNKPALEVQPENPAPEITERGTKMCPKCQGELKSDAVFCTNCGTHLDRDSALASASSGKAKRKSGHSGSGNPLSFLTAEPRTTIQPPSIWIGAFAICFTYGLQQLVLQGFSQVSAIIGILIFATVGLVLVQGAIGAGILMFAFKIAMREDLSFREAWRVVLATVATSNLFVLLVALAMSDEQVSTMTSVIASALNVVVVVIAYRMFLGLSILKAFLIWLVQFVVAIALLFFMGLGFASLSMATSG